MCTKIIRLSNHYEPLDIDRIKCFESIGKKKFSFCLEIFFRKFLQKNKNLLTIISLNMVLIYERYILH